MNAYFNELSAARQAVDIHEADRLVTQLVETMRVLVGQKPQPGALAPTNSQPGFGFHRIRMNWDHSIGNGMTFINWVNQSRQTTLKNTLLGWLQTPFIPNDDALQRDEVLILKEYFIHSEGSQFHDLPVEGLGIAHHVDRPAISLATNAHWQSTQIQLRMDSPEETATVKAWNLWAPEVTQPLRDWLEGLSDPELMKSNVKPQDKSRNISGGHHGRDVLLAFWDRLKHSPYVVEPITSTEFGPRERNFVREAYPDGRLELVLVWEDTGYAMMIHTTGRNYRETEAIGKILTEEYGRG